MWAAGARAAPSDLDACLGCGDLAHRRPMCQGPPSSTSATIQTEDPPCLLCGGIDFEAQLRNVRDMMWSKPGRFDVVRCTGCGLVMTRPRPTEARLGFFYEDTYSRTRRNYRFQTDSRIGRLIPRYRLRTLLRVVRLSERDHLLDVGCSTGDFLQVARATTGCAVYGVDQDQTTIERALGREHTRYWQGTIDDVEPPESGFTVITFFQALEHHRDPVQTLAKARELLAPGGACLVEVPDFGGWWRPVFRRYWMPLVIPQHLVHFERPTLKDAFQRAGFNRIVMHRSMFYPFEGLTSFALLLWRGLGIPRRGEEPARRRLLIPFLLVLLLVWAVLIEVPTQALLRLIGRSGIQLVVATRD